LNADVQRMVENGDMEMGHARALLALEGEHQSSAARTVAGKGLTVRETERLVKKLLAVKSGEPKPASHIDPDVIQLEQRLGEKLGAKVSIQQGARGKGKMVIQYNSLDELDGIIEHIK
ncbi:MAG: chromosome partitioning protein ParB, partial [Gammaproteobacteria bacterium]|nr:chromosome partitioning protein ParB [Gammaproteobacteria bacterium]